MTTPSQWTASKGLAKAILHDRTQRRRLLGQIAGLLLVVFSVGLWVIDGWLAKGLWRFLIWWGGCGVLALFVIVFALYDAMRVIREERERF